MGQVRLLKPNELGLEDEIQIFEDGLRTNSKSGNYEWWYFDSKYEDGSSLVIIFFSKPVTSMKSGFSPYVSFDYIGSNGVEIHTTYKSKDFKLSKEMCDVRIGDCYIKGDLKHYEIYFKNDVVECSLSLDGSVPSWRPYSGHILFGKKDYFAWIPAIPEGVVNGELKTSNINIILHGTGYHDHNWGNKLMLLLMNDWYWGRAKVGDYVVVSSYIYANKKDNYAATPVFMLAKDGKIIADDALNYLRYEEKDFIKDDYTKRYVAKTLIYEYIDNEHNNHYRVTYNKGDEDVERHRMRDIVGKPLAVICYLLGFRGSYHRMGGTVMIEKIEDGKVVEKVESKAMWEQMCFKPDRIKL